MPSSGMYNTRHYESTVQQGFRYRVLLATKSRRNHRQRASGQRGKVGDDASAASGSAIGYEARAWPVMPMRRTDVKLTRLRIGHTRFTHRHLLFGERAPECPSCNVSYTVHHILIDCPVFNHHRITFFHTSILTLSDLASLYVDDLQISCEGSDMRMIERQLQTAVNNIIKWCDNNGHSISASKSCCVHFCRKRGIHPDPEIRIRDIQIPVVPDVLSNTSWGADRTSLLRVYQAIVLSRIDYGCVAYGSACNSTLQKLDPVHHMALRICSGAFRTSPVQSLYVNCHQLPLDLRRRKLSLAFYFKILSVPSHPLQNVYMSTSMKRLYDARPSNIRPFMNRMKLHISELDLPNVRIQQRNLFLFQPWNTPRFHYINPFATYSKSTVAPVVFQRVFAYHRSQYSRYSAIYTDGSKRADYVGCGVVIEDIMHGYRLDTSCSIFTAEAVAIYRALQLIDSTMPRKYCIYTDSMSVLEALEKLPRSLPSSGMYNTRHYESTLQQGFRYRVLLATKSRRNHRQRASGQRGKVDDDASAASGSAIGYEAQARTLIAPQLSQTYAQVAKSSTATSTTQTDENITQIKCPPLQLLQPLLSVPQPNKYPSFTSVSTSSSTTQANLLPSASSIKPTTEIASRLPKPISSSAAPENSLNTSASSLSAETRTLIRSNKSAARAAAGFQLKFNPYQNLTLLHPMVNILMHLKSHSVQNEIQEIEESAQKYRKQKLKSKWQTCLTWWGYSPPNYGRIYTLNSFFA
ncbi:putative RNA-directed DNA polymerase from transposon X-element [Trichonephila clavipes]|nr:putative RNA-directed DNA polymerase from transposon X-element [Trichonephila clavipes]